MQKCLIFKRHESVRDGNDQEHMDDFNVSKLLAAITKKFFFSLF